MYSSFQFHQIHIYIITWCNLYIKHGLFKSEVVGYGMLNIQLFNEINNIVSITSLYWLNHTHPNYNKCLVLNLFWILPAYRKVVTVSKKRTFSFIRHTWVVSEQSFTGLHCLHLALFWISLWSRWGTGQTNTEHDMPCVTVLKFSSQKEDRDLKNEGICDVIPLVSQAQVTLMS